MPERERAAASLRFLAEASEKLSESLDYDLTLSRVTRLVVPDLADWCTVDLLDDDGRIHRVAAAHADPTEEALLHETFQQFPIRLDEPRAVSEAEGRVRVLDAELEQRVDERTRQLRHAQEELETTNQGLVDLAAELEDRVAQRTAELEEKSDEVRAMSQQLWQAAKLATMGSWRQASHTS
jgi:C4-dicarboxylate-specific signal transduction histidine kinase